MKVQDALNRMQANFRRFVKFMGAAAPTSSVFTRDGVTASVVPATPERSIFNSVTYDAPDAVVAHYDEINHAYHSAQINAWTVWVMPDDSKLAQFLETRGHTFDGAPIAMALDLETTTISAPSELNWKHADDLRSLNAINRKAYGITGAAFEEAFEHGNFPDARFYIAHHEHQPACTLATLDVNGDCGFYLVATLPDARGHGYASQLMSVALGEARARGCTTASLQASPMGYPVYRKLGFLDLGKMSMWERRRQTTR